MTDDDRHELIAQWTADDDLHDARAGRYEHTWHLAHGHTTDKLIADTTTLMDAIADPDCWLLSDDPELWRIVMLEHLHDLTDRYYMLTEDALWAPR